MRTKTLFLTAALAVAGALSSQAQNVFSQNVVGYVQQVFQPGLFYMISNPLDNGTNTISSILPTAPTGSSVQLWTGSGYTVVNKGFGGTWSTNGVAYNPVVLPGVGFFVQFGGANPTTNTFLGNVAVSIGSTGTNSLLAGVGAYANLIPYSDSVTNVNTVNLSSVLATGDNIQKWNVGTQQFDVYNKGFGGSWVINGNPLVPTIGVAEGVFVSSAGAHPWVQTLPAQ